MDFCIKSVTQTQAKAESTQCKKVFEFSSVELSGLNTGHPLRVIYERNNRHADRKLEKFVGK